jgi:hypothetical protein
MQSAVGERCLRALLINQKEKEREKKVLSLVVK